MTAVRYGWSRVEHPWRELADASLPTRPWRSSPFAKAWHSQVPTAPGVYIITGSPPIKGAFSTAWCPLYVGQTSNLRSRFGHHLRGGTAVSSLHIFADLRFFYLIVTGEEAETSNLRRYEQVLQDAFGPIANNINAIRRFTVGAPVSI